MSSGSWGDGGDDGGWRLPDYGVGYLQQPVTPKTARTYALLAVLLGWLGLHRLYVGYVWTGLTMLLLGCVAIFAVFFPYALGLGLLLVLVLIGWSLLDAVLAKPTVRAANARFGYGRRAS